MFCHSAVKILCSLHSLDDKLAQLGVNLQLDGNTEPRARVEAALRHVDQDVAILLELVVREDAVCEAEGAEEMVESLL